MEEADVLIGLMLPAARRRATSSVVYMRKAGEEPGNRRRTLSRSELARRRDRIINYLLEPSRHAPRCGRCRALVAILFIPSFAHCSVRPSIHSISPLTDPTAGLVGRTEPSLSSLSSARDRPVALGLADVRTETGTDDEEERPKETREGARETLDCGEASAPPSRRHSLGDGCPTVDRHVTEGLEQGASNQSRHIATPPIITPPR